MYRKCDDLILSRKQAAAYLGISARTLSNWASAKRHVIPTYKVGRLVKYRQSDLDNWLAAQTVGAAA